MKLLTAEQMRKLDATAIHTLGIPGIVLMENASLGVFQVIAASEENLTGLRACIVCGRGNNGGDGFAVARHLLNAGAKPQLVLAAQPSKISGDALTNFNICKKLKIPMSVVTSEPALGKLKSALRGADIVVDALLGTGFRGELRPLFLEIVRTINRRKATVYAVDIPSGVQADDGRAGNAAVRAQHTVTFGAPKIGLFVHPGAEHAGQVYIVDIGIPTTLTEKVVAKTHLTSPAYVATHVLPRAETAHKGDCGRLLIVGGSVGMSGAVCLAGMAALRAGAGLVYLAAPEEIASIVDKKLTEGVTVPLPDVDGGLSSLCIDDLIEKAAGVDAVVLGPGMGVTDDTIRIVETLVREVRVPMLVDADGLNCLARLKSLALLRKAHAPLVLTPHPGEMARLLKSKTSAVQADRLNAARSFAKRHKASLVLKGALSVTAAPGGEVYVNPTGNPGMATAGSGDVLSGVAGAFLAEGMEAFAAAVCGAYIHGAAGDAAAKARGRRAATAGDFARAVALVMKKYEEPVRE